MRSLFFITFVLLLSARVCGQSGEDQFAEELASAALRLTEQEVIYDPGYYAIAYPNGDVPSDRGVCSDVVIRAYRAMGIDLQQEVHEDMLEPGWSGHTYRDYCKQQVAGWITTHAGS